MATPNWDELSVSPPDAQNQASESTAPDWSSLSTKPPEGKAEVPNWDDLQTKPLKDEKYSTAGQQALTALEGAGQGLAGPLATAAELGLSKLGVPGLSAEDIAGRKEANPWEHGIAEGATMAGSMMTGVGEAGLLAKGAAKLLPEALPIFGKLGSKVLGGAVQAMAMQSGDEMTKAMLGQGDPEAPVSAAIAHIGAAGLFGGTAAGVFNVVGKGASKGLQAIENAKLGDKANAWRSGLGMASELHQMGIPESEAEDVITRTMNHIEGFDYKKIKPGVDLYYKGIKAAVDAPTDFIANAAGNAVGLPQGVGFILSQKYLTPFVEKLVNRPLVGASKLIMPTVLNALEKGETKGIYNAMNHATSISKGVAKINHGVESLFKGAGMTAIEDATDKQKKVISDYVDKGGTAQELQTETQPQGFAKGGEVQAPAEDHFGKLYPEQSMLMNAAKGRVSSYLSSMKPQPNPNKLTYDKAPSTDISDRSYDNALNLAAAPLTVLKHIKNGTLQAEHMRHMNAMYPEVTKHLQQKLTAKIIQAKMDEEQPSYKTRMAMSLFLGSALDSTMTPAGIQAAQATYIPNQTLKMPGSPQGKTKKGTSNLGKSNKQYNTADQAAESDRSARD